jgi:hypothetical protein
MSSVSEKKTKCSSGNRCTKCKKRKLDKIRKDNLEHMRIRWERQDVAEEREIAELRKQAETSPDNAEELIDEANRRQCLVDRSRKLANRHK